MSGALDVAATRIRLARGGRAVLDDVSVAIPAGRFAALVGPSGSGKTTLLTVLAGLQDPDHGDVRYGGRTVTAATRGPWTGRVQLAHQAFGLLSLLTAAENVELALQALPAADRPTRRGLRAAAREALAAVGLAARAEHRVDDLSGGEQQRIALARALVTRPDLLLADEPTAQLDAENRERVTALLEDRARSGTTVIVATHDGELSARCDPVFALRDGALQ